MRQVRYNGARISTLILKWKIKICINSCIYISIQPNVTNIFNKRYQKHVKSEREKYLKVCLFTLEFLLNSYNMSIKNLTI